MAKLLIPTLALAATVLAQTSTVCNGPSITVNSDSDASQIASCSTYNGDVIIGSSASGVINLNGVQTINGNLKCSNASGLNAINANSLTTITNTFMLNGLTTLSTLNMGYLSRVASINWVALPALQELSFATGVREANDVYISNTQLNTLQGIELTQVGSIDINNNQYLTDINVNGLTNITRYLSFAANGMNLDVEFPNLQSAGNLTFRNVSSVSMPSLSQVDSNIGLYSNYFLNFSAPNLTSIGSSLAVIDNSALTTFSFPLLTTIGGGFIVVNNSNLEAINNIPKLTTVVGAIEFIGTFSNVDAHSLHDVRGGATVLTSSQNQTICNVFSAAAKNQIIKGTESCQTGAVTAQTNGSSSSSGSGSGKKNAAATLSVAPFTALLGLAAYMLL